MNNSGPFIRFYEPTDLEGCLRCFQSNMPKFFLLEELPLFEDFLRVKVAADKENLPYYVLLSEGEIIGCGGLGQKDGKVALTWGMVHHDFHKKGFGEKLLQYRLEQSKILFPNLPLRLDTTQYSVGFFEKYGFQTEQYTPDGYGAGMHRYDMEFGVTS